MLAPEIIKFLRLPQKFSQLPEIQFFIRLLTQNSGTYYQKPGSRLRNLQKSTSRFLSL